MAKILIAEDESEVIQFCTWMLQNQGHTILSSTAGFETMEKLRGEKPDLLILDVMLPEIDGYTLLLQMEQEEALSHIQVIVMTALKPSEELFKKSGQVSGFLAKPFSREDFLDAVHKALEKSGKN